MGFMVGFVDQMNRIIDKKERQDLLKSELNVKRQETLMALMAKNKKRTQATTDTVAAAQALKTRLGDQGEQGEQWFNAVVKSGKAGEVLEQINDMELKDENRELRLEGPILMETFKPYFTSSGQSGVKALSFEEIMSSDLSNNDTYLKALSQTHSALGETGSVVDVNAKAAFSGSNKLRKEAVDEFDRLLVENLASRVNDSTGEENATLVRDLNALSGDNAAAKAAARARLMKSPEGFQTYASMVESSGDVPSYGVLSNMPGQFSQLSDLYTIVGAWDRLTPENQAKALAMYPFIEDLI